jgi:hypothetical protein
MKRSVWIPVLVVSTVMSAASLLPRTSWRDLGARAASLAQLGAGAVRVAVREAVPVAAQAARSVAAARVSAAATIRGALAHADAGASAAAVPATVATALLALLAWTVVRRSLGRHRRARARVIRLARRGAEPGGIARRTGLSRDAVRMALRPELTARRGAEESSARRPPLPPGRPSGAATVAAGPMRRNDLQGRLSW